MVNITIDDKIKLVQSLFKRINHKKLAMELFKKKYPQASENIISTLAFHLYVDGHVALLDMLCELELFLSGEKDDICYGHIFEVILRC